MLTKLLFIGVLLLCLGWLAFAGGPIPVVYLYIVNSLSQDVSVINTTTDTLTATIPLGARGYRLAFSPKGDRAYVTCFGGPLPGKLEAKADTEKPSSELLVVDLALQQVVGRIPVDLSALANVHIYPNGSQSFVVTAAGTGSRNVERGRVLFVDLASGKVTGGVNVGLNPLDSVMTPDGGKLYTADWGSRSISIVDLAEGRLLDTIPLGMNPARVLALRPDGKKVYAATERLTAGQVTYQAMTNVQQAGRPAQPTAQQAAAQQPPPHVEENLIWEIDTETNSVTKHPFDGLSPVYALTVSPEGSKLYAYGRVSRLRASTGIQVGEQQAGASGQRGDAPQGKPVMTKGGAGEARAKGSDQPGPQAVQPMTTQGPPAEVYDLVVVDLNEKRLVQRFGGYGFLSAMALSADGSKLYLIGTPGDPTLEAALRTKNMAIQQKLADQASSLYAAEVSGITTDLSRLPKTVTILDAKTGAILKTLTIGSLPQSCGLLRK